MEVNNKVNQYIIYEVICSNSHAITGLCRDVVLGTDWFIKYIPALKQTAELDHLLMLDHRRIPKIIDVIKSEEGTYYVMDNIKGFSLNEYFNYYTEGNENAMMNKLIPVRNWAVENNVAVICNEFGAYEARTDEVSRANYFRVCSEIFKELKIGWSVWFGQFRSNGDLISGAAEALELNR